MTMPQIVPTTSKNAMALIAGGGISMTSQEIAELVEKRHDNVKRTIETLAYQGVISRPQIEDGIKSANGVVPRHYRFTGEQGKRDSIIVVAQLSPSSRHALLIAGRSLSASIPAQHSPTFQTPLKQLGRGPSSMRHGSPLSAQRQRLEAAAKPRP